MSSRIISLFLQTEHDSPSYLHRATTNRTASQRWASQFTICRKGESYSGPMSPPFRNERLQLDCPNTVIWLQSRTIIGWRSGQSRGNLRRREGGATFGGL